MSFLTDNAFVFLPVDDMCYLIIANYGHSFCFYKVIAFLQWAKMNKSETTTKMILQLQMFG